MLKSPIVLILCGAALAPLSCSAAGCLKGAAVGGVAGHVAGHHAVLGAAAGCAIGHHEAAKRAKEQQANSTPQAPLQPVAPQTAPAK
jgi:hypothetical protein